MDDLSKLIEDYREKYIAEEKRKEQVSIQRKAVYNVIEFKLEKGYRYGLVIVRYQDKLYDEIIKKLREDCKCQVSYDESTNSTSITINLKK